MDDTLRKLQLIELEILKTVHAFCMEHDIKYSLYAGTLLGAVRHKGFIPWDDDIDICMARAEYNRFIALWEQDPPDGYTLQNKDNTPAFTQSFTKIRKDGTTFVQMEGEAGKYHNGVFLDVFPIDRIPCNMPARIRFTVDCYLYQLLTREFVPPKSGAAVKLGSRILLGCIHGGKRPSVRKKLLARITRFTDPQLCTVAIETTQTIRMPLPANLLDDYTTLSFGDGEFMCFSAWDAYLSRKYGDYMQLPPEAERTWKHHPILVDFEHSFEEIIDGAKQAEKTSTGSAGYTGPCSGCLRQ